VRVSLQGVLRLLPEDCRPQLARAIPKRFHLEFAVAELNAQLGRGCVKVRGHELRRAAPPELFASWPLENSAWVQLPLEEIVAQLDRSFFGSSKTRKRVDVPDEVTPVFGPQGHVVVPGSTPADRRADVGPRGKVAGVSTLEGPVSLDADPCDERSSGVATLALELGQVSESWPAAIIEALETVDPAQPWLDIPLVEIDTALKRGKVEFSWQQVRAWLRAPSAPLPSSALDAVNLLFPLHIVVPLFLQHKRQQRPQRLAEVGADIPAVFAGGAAVREAQPDAPRATGNGDASAAGNTAPAVAPGVGSAPIELGQLLGRAEKKDWTAKAIVEAAVELPGIGGAVIGSADGLLVAGKLPRPWSVETWAAFLPQLFGRLQPAVTELGLNGVRRIVVQAGDTWVSVFAVGDLRFAFAGAMTQTISDLHVQRMAEALHSSLRGVGRPETSLGSPPGFSTAQASVGAEVRAA
jgi:predicted regulator of Ras-like GTPase activity (Roadblock/LC7/MglB family)